ncbi:hypothetical protein MCOR27_007048 [Pyricularia oryzae]|uniref:histidine kinase n=2 Tax=Pyricularia TaxID=48558 RepID=A0ABQ8N7A6_PYRGI|nr:hypothetical protein MCOR01_006402 [Pyricularia oryzae]KAI6292438.1 hypothetical protein MCOR33_009867 [Pyricularia grisea]KAH9435746.1 hypothetical protein MCOR02_004665 [Pyricularia oryzae]KAI6258584.1 hypothetical protein MCOR19_005041 [Pyricularia oryzae]KAI6265309.1 hypothetical protein MCOR26_010809 [Pyricularia oryzae]
MSGWLKSGMGSSSPSEEPRSPAASPAQALGGRNKNTDKSSKARISTQKPQTFSSKSKATSDAANQNEAAPRAEGSSPAMELAAYREQLKKQMSAISSQEPPRNSPKRPSPIAEEESPPPGIKPFDSGPATTASTNSSTATIRGLATPGVAARTPSYPFPRMTSMAGLPSHLHRPFTALSPTGTPEANPASFQDVPSALDKILSNPSTPASTLTFQPHGASVSNEEPTDFPTPNLYELSLMLSAEPGLDAWWQTVVQILTEVYKAERVTLAVPADTTDIENVPWGQKATYNARGEDDLSMAYMARGSSVVPSGTDVRSEITAHPDLQGLLSPTTRPDLSSRHSFTSFESRQNLVYAKDTAASSSPRPSPMPRSKSSYPVTVAEVELEARESRPALSQKVLEEHDAIADDVADVPGWGSALAPPTPTQARVLPMLQALDFEADPLIDHNGIRRVLERGKVIALTRSYPYLDHQQPPAQAEETKGRTRSRSPDGPKKQPQHRRPRPESFSKLSSLLGGAQMYRGSKGGWRGDKKRQGGVGSRLDDEDMPRPPTPKYEEYEQAPPSPWSQSPAPSPAIRAEPSENPFFTDAVVDEDSFNPASAPPPDYTALKPPETIGVDNSWTVLHIPLSHVLLSRPTATFKLDTSTLERKSHIRSKSAAGGGDPSTPVSASPSSGYKEKHSPIAVLSILSPIIPYPSNLRHSLAHLAPHLATSFSLCRHYTNLEVELAGLQKRNPDFIRYSSSLGTDGRLIADPVGLELTSGEVSESQRSLGGSMTSPSDYSVPSRSAAGSAVGTPSWDVGNLGFVTEKRQVAASPLVTSGIGDSYFSAKPTSSTGRGPGTPGAVNPKERRNSRESAVGEKRFLKRSSGTKGQWVQDSAIEDQDPSEESAVKRASEDLHSIALDKNEKATDSADGQRRGSRTGHKHTQLHSYGADFSHTFQSLPPSSTVGMKSQQPPSRSGSGSVPREMLPPSDTLKGLILDSLPAHVFVAQPPAGDMLWVNSRYLVYRGVTPAELAADPYGSLHPDDKEEYIKAWTYSLRTGEPFSRTVRIKRFDNAYRWFQARAIATRDKRNTVQQFLGSYMDIHDQHTAELKAARQEEIEASEAKHRLLANLIPQIIFTATEDEGITFANEQWLSYTGQSFEDSLGLGFMDYVHPDDLAKCRIPTDFSLSAVNTPMPFESATVKTPLPGTPGLGRSTGTAAVNRPVPNPGSTKLREMLSRHNSSSSSSSSEATSAGDLLRLAKKGVIKAGTDSSGRISYTTEVRLRSKTGEYRWHLIRCVEIGGVNWGSGVSSYFGSATDINDHKLLETKLKEAMESKGRFLSNMSHEIRTPLIGISGMVSFLQETTLTEEQRDYTNTIHTSANSLIMIINDILDLSKVDAGMMKLKYEWFHTTSLIEAVNELVSTMAIAKGLELNYIVEPEVPAWVKGDKVRIRQVLLNVIGNAIKFTSEGEVFSRCSVATVKENEIGEDEIMLEFSIIDTGRGFTKDESELIFKPFSQIDGSSTRQHGGSGLGLVISRQLVELHGGQMNGTATPGKGSTFTFTAKFGLPTDSDRPESLRPSSSVELVSSSSIPEGLQAARLFKHPSLPMTNSPSVVSPASTDPSVTSPATGSSASSDPSVRSNKTHDTARTSISSTNAGLVNFSEAARASGQDLSQMKLEMPDMSTENTSSNNSNSTLTPDLGPPRQQRGDGQRPTKYSILVISPQTHSREATTKHIEMTLPKEVPRKITPLATVTQAQQLIREADAITFTHVVVNLPSTDELIGLMGELMRSKLHSKATVLILSDSVQRQAIVKQVAGTEFESLMSDDKVNYIYKPVKPSRFAVIFDPSQERDLSIDRNRSTAEQIVETQKQSYAEIEKRMGNRGLRVLLVEDNPINQKVLIKYLKKVGVAVEVARDGEECTEMVFGHGPGYFALILCDLHMPKKDGYTACREVRQWEQQTPDGPKLPIIALSANVMADVQERCIQAGFDAYVTKPVDFVDLSNTLARFF